MSGERIDNNFLINADGNSGQSSKNGEDNLFDEIIGHIEDILLEEEFNTIQKKFLDMYWNVFEPIEENKLIYTDIFNEYHKAVENYIVNYLQKVIPHFNINKFLQLLSRQTELEGEVFEVLSTFTDFVAFKEMFLDYRAVKEGKVQDLSSGISVTCLKVYNMNEIQSSPI
ncbi:ADP-ribosylation factor-like protein 2-binding protein isoform X2 [Hylaeus anthracinus]|uniref:ADP-ribosylation factor-like protein 2-binding protein isoform X2 n=1 Tax=Hylaeus volcanicus TaxID=313075 RepID=UPI0023B79F9A|nr:ADP-ribosylation factor-like protein 2-binding protein isoform X2 [Hylaeus volcanicus]XP_053999250.1 ADP-ribosylation factor-like protein 2-binding protein isoform X2 [Hylaeus anthracinus]